MGKARLAYGMVRKTYGIVPSTATFYKTEFLRALNSGYRATFAWVAAQEQILPRSGYAGLSLFLQQYYVDVAQTGFILSGTDSILDKLAEVVTKVSGSSAGTPEQLKSEIKRSIHTEMSKVIEKLGLEESIKSETLSAAGFFQGAETGIIFRSLTEKTTNIMTEKLAELLENPSKFLSGSGSSVSVNAQKSIDLAPIEIMLASDMGFPVIVEVRAPVTASLTGKATINALSMAPSVTINGKVLLATQYTGFVGTLVPFTSEYVATGIDQHSIINIPGTVEMKLDIPSQKLSIMVEPVTHEPTALAHYHILPYTTVGQINKLQPITMTPALKAIKAIPERKVLESTFGEYLGLGLKTKLVTESRFVDMRSIVEYLNIYKNPVNMLVFGWTSPALSENLVPSVRYHKMTTLLEPARTSTKALGLEIKIGAATKVEGQTGIQYHTLKKSPISGLSHEEIKEVRTNPTIVKIIKALSPLKVVSHGIESQVHERRQNNLKMVMSELESSKVSEASVTGFTLTTNFILKLFWRRSWTWDSMPWETTLSGLKLRHDHLQVVLATLVDLGLDAVGDNLQWAQGLDYLHDGWGGPDLLDLLVGETGDWGLLQGVVLDASLALNLGGSSDLNLQTKSLGGSPGWLQEGGHLVVANRWDKVLRKSWGSPAEDQHVDWVLVDVQVLNNGPHVDKPGLSDQLGLEAKTQVLSEGGLQDLPLWDSLDGLEGWGHGDWLELVDLANSGVWQDVVVGKSGWLVGDWLDHDGQLLGWDVQLHLNGSWDVDDGVLVNTGGNVLRGEWNKSSDKSGVLGGEEDLSIDGDRWGHGESVDGCLSGQGSGDWGTDLNNDWESHVGSQHDLDWGKVDGLLGVDRDRGAGAREELGWVLEELSKLLSHNVGGLLSQGAEDDSSLGTLEESGAGDGLRLDRLLEAELLNDLGHLRVDGALDLRLQLLWGASRGSGDLSDDLGELVKDGVSAGEDEASLGNIDVVLLEEEGEASVARPWEDLLLSSNPGKGGPISGVQSPQELSLVEGGGGWDNAVGLPDHTVSKPGLSLF